MHFDEFIKNMHIDLYHLPTHPKNLGKVTNIFKDEIKFQVCICCAFVWFKRELGLMFMKHYAPNRRLYIKVAKLRTGVGSAETSYLQNCSVKLFKEHFKV